MHKLTSSLLIAGTAAGIALSQSAVAADAPAAPYTLTANVGLYSQYVFRGLTQTNGDPAIQGGFDFTHSSGFYLGTWASNISWLKENATTSTTTTGTYKNGGSMEWDFYGGYKGSVSDFGYDVGLLQYYYPGDVNSTTPSTPKANTLEGYIAGSWKWFTLKYSHALSDNVFGTKDARGTSYWDLSANFPIADTGLTFGAHYGVQTYKGRDDRLAAGVNNDQAYSYDDWKVSLSYDLSKAGKTFDGMTVDVAYTDTHGANCYGYGAYTTTCTVNGVSSLTGAYPKKISGGNSTVWISKTF